MFVLLILIKVIPCMNSVRCETIIYRNDKAVVDPYCFIANTNMITEKSTITDSVPIWKCRSSRSINITIMKIRKEITADFYSVQKLQYVIMQYAITTFCATYNRQ